MDAPIASRDEFGGVAVEDRDEFGGVALAAAPERDEFGGISVSTPTSNKLADAARRIPSGVQSGTGRTLAGAVRAVDIAATPTFIPFMGGLGPGAETINRLNQQMPAVREEFVRGRPQRLAESTAYQLGREIEQAAPATFGVDPARDNEFLAQLATAAGEMVPTLAAGAVAGPAGVGVSIGPSMGESQAQEAIAAGHPELADVAFISAAGLSAFTEAALGVPGRLLAMANRARKAGVNPGTFGRWANRNPMAAGIARAGAEGALREGAQEGLEQAGQNLIASDVAGYDPNRPVGQGVGRAAALGATLGVVIGGGAAGINQANRNQQAAALRSLRDGRQVIVNEQTGTTEFPPLEGDELPPPPPPAPPAGPANVAPPIRGEAAMQTRPSAGWTPDGPRTPAVDPELAAAIAAIRAGYNPEVDAPAPAPAPPSTFNLQPSAPLSPATPPTGAASAPTAEAAPPGLSTNAELADAIQAVREGYDPEIETDAWMDAFFNRELDRRNLIRAYAEKATTVELLDRLERDARTLPEGFQTEPLSEIEHRRKSIKPAPRPSRPLPEAPGVPTPLEGQPYEPGLLQRPEAAMETRRAAPLDLQREPAVSPELADTIQALRQGYQQQLDAPAETLTPGKALDLSVRHEAEQKQLPINRRLFWHGSPEVKSVGGRFLLEKHRTDRGDWGRGAYLTQFPGITRNYGEVAHPLVADVSNPASKTDVERVQRALRSGREKYLAGEDTASATTRLLQKEGFDSAAVSFTEDPEAISELVVFDPSKIKSASTFPAWISDNFKGKLRFPEEFKRQGDSYVFKPATSPQPTPPDQSGGPTELTPPAKAEVDELSKLRQQAKELDAKIQKSKSGTEANRKRLAEWMRLTARIAKLETGQTTGVTAKPAEVRPAEPGEQPQPPAQAAPAMQEGMDNLRFTSEPVAKAKSGAPDAKDAKAKLIAELEKAVEQAQPATKQQAAILDKGPTVPRRGQDSRYMGKFGDRNYAEDVARLRADWEAAAQATGLRKVTIEIPGDGTFTVWNTKENLTELLKRAKRLETSTKPTKGYTETGVAKEDREWVEQMRAAQGKPMRLWEVRYQDWNNNNLTTTVEARSEFEAEDKVGNEVKGAQKILPGTKYVGEASPSAVDSAIAALESAKIKPGGLYSLPDLGLTVTLWNGTLTAAQVALRATRSLAQAVQAGVDWLRAQGQQFDEAKVRAALEQALPPELAGRANALKQMANPGVSPRAKEFIAPQVPYTRESRAEWQRAAQSWMATFDNPQWAAAEYWQMRDRLPGPVWVALGLNIAQQLNALETAARAAGRTAEADALGTLNGNFRANFVQVSTDVARTLNAYGMMSVVEEMGPFAADVFAQRTIEQASQKQKQRLKPTLDAAKQQLDDLNRTGIEEAARTPEVQGTARTVINQTIEEEARQAGTPIQQAIAAEVVAQLQTAGRLNAVEAAIVREHFGQNPEPLALADKLERAGVKPAKARAAELEGKYKDGVEAFRAKLRQKLTEARQKNIDPATLGIVDRAIRQRLAELQVKLGALVRAHWTQQERVGQTLAESLVQEAGLPEAQATRLADAVQRRFKALVQARKEKALRNLAKTPGARELQKPTVAQRIIEATNLGALDSEGLWQAVAEKLGLPTYTAEASAEVKRLAERAQQLPEGSVQRQEATARMMRYIARQKNLNLADLGWAFWYANTLSGPITHAVNTFSNVLSLAANTATQFRDVRGIPQVLVATAKGFRTGLTEARAIVKQGPGANRTKFTEQGQALENLDPQDFTGAGLVSQWRYVARALAAADAAFYFPAREAKAITLARALARQEGKTGAAIRTRAQQVIDGTEEQQNLWGAQVDRERAQLEAMGEQPDALWTTRRLEQLREQAWGADIGEAADDFALRTTYNNRPYGFIGELADAAKRFQRVPVIGRATIPFVNVVANVVNDSINYTPWGFARAYAASRTGEPSVTLSLPFEWAENLREGKSPMTPDAVVDLHAKAALGTVMVGSLMGLALAGLDDDDGENFQLYGSGPKDAAAKAALRETGWLPYSVRVNGKYLSFANTPLAIPLGALGHYLDAARYDKRFEQADAFNRLGVALWGGAHIITQQSFLDGLARLLGALEDRRGRIDTASDRAVEQAFRSVSSVAVPNALRQLDRLFDPTIYDARGIEGALVAGIPFARRNGSPALNAFGEPITNEPWKRFASDAEANVWTDLARRKIYPSVADKAKNANGREMTDDEHYRYVQESGQAIKRRLETPGMRQMIRSGKEEDARKAVTAIVREERERARRRLGF